MHYLGFKFIFILQKVYSEFLDFKIIQALTKLLYDQLVS